MLKISGIALAAALSLAACDGSGVTDPIDLREGQFGGEIRGTLDGWLQGTALSGSTTAGFHDLIELTDYSQRIEIILYHDTDEFYPGRFPIGDGYVMNADIVAYVRDLDTGEWFDSLDGVIDLYEVYGGGIRGTAAFRAESEDFPGDVVSVDVDFATAYDGSIDFNLSPSFSANANAAKH
ncbi:MAG TPA: hypothetical protein VFR37_03615 [Longimicrobium sp.]|nr:hypothetical protein [Longimicrobium sp.]